MVKSSSRRVQIMFNDPSLTQQEFKDQCDISKVMSQYQCTGVVVNVRDNPGYYGDFTGIDDYRSAMESIEDARIAFAELPANIRARFGHEPSELLRFLGDENNREEAIKLGFIQSGQGLTTESEGTKPGTVAEV